MDAKQGDYHVHSWLCRHGTGTLEEYVESAISKGIPEIGFNEHFPMFFLPSNLPLDSYAMTIEEFGRDYVAEIQRLREVYGGQVEILIGAEVDYYPGKEGVIGRAIEAFPLDYIYLSVHVLPNEDFGAWCIDDDRYEYVYGKVPVDEVYNQYFETLERGVNTGLFDIVGHIDLPKKFRHFPTSRGVVEESLERLVRAISSRNMCVEVNTAGWRKPVGEQYPSTELMKRLADAGVEFVLGSDSHDPRDVGFRFDDAVELLAGIGVTRLVRFRGREKRFVPTS
ncbi:MAG: histidinol-phosphatase HisJ [Promethearchaeota archaeon]